MSIIWKMRLSVKRLLYCTFCLLCLFLFGSILQVRDMFNDISQKLQAQEEANSLISQRHPLCFIPQKTLRVWDERDFLVVFGIPSIDIPIRRWRRKMQRNTCWQFPEVSTRHNNYTGAILVLYLLARHPLNNFALSEALVEDAEQWRDIIIHPMNEGNPTTNKIKDGKGWWGVEAEIGSGRKTFFWFQFALQQFPRVPYVGKGDDDMFLRVPQYLMDLRRLPRTRTYWGRYVGSMVKVDKNGTLGDVKFVLGYCVTLARDVATQFVSYKPLQRLALLPYSKDLEPEFTLLTMDHEDVMIGRILQLTGYSFIIFADGGERFHTDRNVTITNNFVVTHAPSEDEYYFLMKRFWLNSTTTEATIIKEKSPRLFFLRPPRKKQ